MTSEPTCTNNSYAYSYSHIAEELKEGILAERYSKVSPLPSSRTLALQYGVSRSTILAAFGLLAREGLLRVSQGQAPVIVDLETNAQTYRHGHGNHKIESHIAGSQMPAIVSPHLPVQKWFGHISKLAKKAQSKDFFIDSRIESSIEPSVFELKMALRNYLNRQRKINCHLEQIFVFENLTAAMTAIAAAFSISGERRVLIDAPNLAASARQLARFSNNIEAVEIAALCNESHNQAISFHPQSQEDTRLGSFLYTTPSIRLGSTRSLDQASRQSLIEWAKRNNSHILEHDYGHEFCSGPSSQPAIFSLDRSSSVAYLVDFSSSLAPLTNLCAVVVPNAHINLFKRHHNIEQSSGSIFESQTLTAFLSSGFLERHSRKSSQQCLQNLAEMKRIVTEKIDCKSVQIKLIKSGKDAILELGNDAPMDVFKPAFERQLLKPSAHLFGTDHNSRKLIIAGEHLNQANRELLLACLNQYTSRLTTNKVYASAIPSGVFT
jgi:GntR family transcriptional regulator/MocR family aminotransferase